MALRCCAYALDLGLRVYGLGLTAFVAKRRNLLDAAVVLLTVTHAVALVMEDAESPLRVLRLLRVFRRMATDFSLFHRFSRSTLVF